VVSLAIDRQWQGQTLEREIAPGFTLPSDIYRRDPAVLVALDANHG
jgi:hypothetical protein